ncbi:MAG: rod shape-determining protein RodA [Bdellovibrionota bacterium]
MELSMRLEERTFFRKLDWQLVIIIIFLQVIGLVNLYSATHGPNDTSVEQLFINQFVWLGVGWSLFFIVTIFDYAFVMKIALAIYVLNLGAILYVTFFGKVALGAQRWINLGFFNYQPSETMKLALVMVIAKMMAHRTIPKHGMGFKGLMLPLILLGIPFVLVVEQPDLGTALMLLSIGISMIVFLKVRKYIVVMAVLAAIVAVPIAWRFVLHDYQKNRILTFVAPHNDPRGSGYNSIQSKIAVGSGKFLGKGFKKGTQSQLEFLPERHTDFIYSVLSEEWGFVGSLLTISLFTFLFLQIVRIATHARDKFGSLLCVGILCYIFWHMFVNVGMVIGLLPIVGVPLPLVSYGGSSMLTTMVGLGLVSSVAYRRYLF